MFLLGEGERRKRWHALLPVFTPQGPGLCAWEGEVQGNDPRLCFRGPQAASGARWVVKGRWWQLELEVHPSSQPWQPLVKPPEQRQSQDGHPWVASNLTGGLGSGGGRSAWRLTCARTTLALGRGACQSVPAAFLSSSPCPGEAGTLGLEEGQAAPKALLQELHVGGRGRVFKGG